MAGTETAEETTVRVQAEPLRELVRRLFVAAGVPEDDARTVSEVLVEADLRGVDSHGTTRTAGYLSMIKLGLLNPRPNVQVLRETPTMAMLEGDNAFGMVVAKRAMSLAVEKARQTTIACVTVRNVTHTGMLAFYTMQAAREGFIGMTCNNGPRILPAFGGRTPIYATNPISFAFPAGDAEPIVLDMATSVVAAGKLRLAGKKGAPIPPDWALDRDGVPTTDAHEAIFHGFMQWAGGYKGFGLAAAIDALGGVLSGGLFGSDVPAMKAFGQEPLVTSGFYMAINPEHFMPLDEFRARIDRVVGMIEASETAKGVDEVFVPGEPERRKRAERLANGIPLTRVVHDELRGLAAGADIPFGLD